MLALMFAQSPFRTMHRPTPIQLSSMPTQFARQERHRRLAIEQRFVNKLQRVQNAVIRQESKHLHNTLRRLGVGQQLPKVTANPPSRGGEPVSECGADYQQQAPWMDALARRQPCRKLPVIVATTITWGSPPAESQQKTSTCPIPSASTAVDEEIVRIVKEQRVRLEAAVRQRSLPRMPAFLHRHVTGNARYGQMYEKTVRGRYKCVRRPHRLNAATAAIASPHFDPLLRKIGRPTDKFDARRDPYAVECAAPATSPVDWATSQRSLHSTLLLMGDAGQEQPTSPLYPDCLPDRLSGDVGWSETSTRASSICGEAPLTPCSMGDSHGDRRVEPLRLHEQRLHSDKASGNAESVRDSGLCTCLCPPRSVVNHNFQLTTTRPHKI